MSTSSLNSVLGEFDATHSDLKDTEVYVMHLLHAHLQVMLWKTAHQRSSHLQRPEISLNLGGKLLREGLSCPLFPPRQWLQLICLT